MKPAERRAFLKQVVFVTWAMVTLTLLFCVGLLVNQMIQRGQNPLDVVEPAPVPLPISQEPAETRPTEEVLVYFTDGDERYLVPEPRSIPFSDQTVENCRSALTALIEGPRDNGAMRPVLSETTKFRALYLLEDGELVIDFSRELIVEHKRIQSAAMESLMVYGVVQTLTQAALKGPKDAEVKTVRFLVEGARPRDSFPAHIDVSEPFAPDRRWVAVPAL